MAMTTSSTRDRSAFSTDASFSAQVPPITAPSASKTSTSTASRFSTEYSQRSIAVSVSSTASGSVSARKPTRPRLTPISAAELYLASSAARRNVPSPPKTITISAPRAASASAGTTSAPSTPSSSASSSSTRTVIPARCRRGAERCASSTMSRRPVCTASSTCRPRAGLQLLSLTVSPRLVGSLWSYPHGLAHGVLPRWAGVAAQPQEELHVARRTRQRAGDHAGGAPAELLRRPGHLQHGGHPVLQVAYHAPGAQPLPADLELRLDHRQQVGAGVRAGGERRKHQPQRDERQVG